MNETINTTGLSLSTCYHKLVVMLPLNTWSARKHFKINLKSSGPLFTGYYYCLLITLKLKHIIDVNMTVHLIDKKIYVCMYNFKMNMIMYCERYHLHISI